MKFLLRITFIFFLNGFFSFSNAQTFEWAKSSIGSGTDEGWNVATDNSGSIVVTGFYYSPFFSLGMDTVINTGGSDIFLGRFDANGNPLWTRTAGGNNNDASYSIATDKSGNIYIAGWFQSPTISFGSITLNTVGAQDIFLAKYDSTGNIIWAKGIGGTSTDVACGVATDTAGNVFITGEYYSSTISFGSITLTNSGSNSIFVAKCDSAGNFNWAKKATASSNQCKSESIATDLSGNIFQTGYFNSNSISFGTYTLLNNNSGADNVFTVKYDNAGNILWAKSSQGAGSNYGFDVTADRAGNCYIIGLFSYAATISFGTLILNNSNQSTSEVFIVKYDATGNEKWARSGSGAGDDDGFSVAADTSGNIYLSGGYDRNANQFSSISFGNDSLPFPAGGKDPMFVVKYDSTGIEICAESFATGGDDNNAIAIDKNENICLTGDFFINPFVVGADTLFLTNPSNSNNENVFLINFSMKCSENSIEELSSSDKIKLFPNPSTGTFYLEQTDTHFQNGKIIITDVLGKIIYQSEIKNSKTEINLTGNTSGIYFYKISSEKGIVSSGKIILN